MGRGSHDADSNTRSPRRTEVDAQVTAELAAALKSRFLDLAGEPGKLDRPTLEALRGLYGSRDTAEILNRYVDPFIRARRSDLRRLFAAYAEDPRRPAMLESPVSILILERLTNDRFSLRQGWPAQESMDSYERLAAIWGVPSPFSAS